MTTWIVYLLFGSLALLSLAILVLELRESYTRLRGTRIVTCPLNEQKAAVAVNAWKAAIPVAAGRPPTLCLVDCSRWPDQCACQHRCLSQIAAAPRETLLRSILEDRYRAQRCAFCNHSFTQDAHGSVRALVDQDGAIIDVLDIPPQRLEGLIASHEPVCKRCYSHLAFPRGQKVFFTGARPVDGL